MSGNKAELVRGVTCDIYRGDPELVAGKPTQGKRRRTNMPATDAKQRREAAFEDMDTDDAGPCETDPFFGS